MQGGQVLRCDVNVKNNFGNHLKILLLDRKCSSNQRFKDSYFIAKIILIIKLKDVCLFLCLSVPKDLADR